MILFKQSLVFDSQRHPFKSFKFLLQSENDVIFTLLLVQILKVYRRELDIPSLNGGGLFEIMSAVPLSL